MHCIMLRLIFITMVFSVVVDSFLPLRRSAVFFSTSTVKIPRIRVCSSCLSATSLSQSNSKRKNRLNFSTVTLKRTQQSRAFREGNQLVFTRAIERSDPSLTVGDLVHVEIVGDVNKHKEKQPNVPIGWGVFNPDSLYKIRMLNHKFLQADLYKSVSSVSDEEEALALILKYHVKTAISMRRAINLPEEGLTNTYRLINGEGDSLSGLAVDVVASKVVIMSSAAWCERYRDTIESVLQHFFPDSQLIWKKAPARLKQDGLLVHDSEDEYDEEREAEMTVSTENGIQYETYPGSKGQKTGVYCDQRENRQLLSTHAKSKTVLDLCCFTGGFSLNAAKHGASHCTTVDSSPVAIEMCRANALRNGFNNFDFVQADISEFLQKTSTTHDIVVLDPPKLAPSAKLLDKARRKYHSLNRDAIAVVEPTGGLLLTCTCSAAMTQAEGGQLFLKMVQGAALSAGREITLLSVTGAASCHTQSPISYPASAYLTAALFYVHPNN